MPLKTHPAARQGVAGPPGLRQPGKTISAAQCRAARALLGWSQGTLAEKSGLSRKTVADFESARHFARDRSHRRLVLTLECAGVEFIGAQLRLVEDRTHRDGEGVRFAARALAEPVALGAEGSSKRSG